MFWGLRGSLAAETDVVASEESYKNSVDWRDMHLREDNTVYNTKGMIYD